MKNVLSILLISLGMLSCKQDSKKEVETEATVTEEVAIESEWVSLMDASKWRGFNQDSLPSNWIVKDSIIACFGNAEDHGGDITSTEQYDNFELSLEWKISPGGNSGIFYHVIEDTIYHSPYQTGSEYQILDDLGYTEPVKDWQLTGANYAMHATNDKKKLMPVGAWNSSKIIFNKGKVEHWLNGEKIVEFDKFSDDWKKRKSSSKWNDYPDYGKANIGHFGLQDHGARVWFRKVKVRRL